MGTDILVGFGAVVAWYIIHFIVGRIMLHKMKKEAAKKREHRQVLGY